MERNDTTDPTWLTAELVGELRALFARGPEHAAYRINRVMFFQNQWIRHGEWYPDRVLRLFRADAWSLPVREVHESVDIDGSIGELRGELPHYSYQDWEDRNRRIEKYAGLWACQEIAKGRKSIPLEAYLRAAWRFFRAYVIKLGFLEGLLGYRIASSCAREVRLKYLALHAKQSHQASNT
jgi:hypothetical protein